MIINGNTKKNTIKYKIGINLFFIDLEVPTNILVGVPSNWKSLVGASLTK